MVCSVTFWCMYTCIRYMCHQRHLLFYFCLEHSKSSALAIRKHSVIFINCNYPTVGVGADCSHPTVFLSNCTPVPISQLLVQKKEKGKGLQRKAPGRIIIHTRDLLMPQARPEVRSFSSIECYIYLSMFLRKGVVLHFKEAGLVNM